MKRICYFIVSVCFIALLPSCESHNQPADTGETCAYFTIVKFIAPEYSDYVVAGREFEEGLCRIASAHGGYACQELFMGSSPYIALPDGYYATDWKWGEFIYPPINILIDVKWNEVDSINQTWEYPSILISTKILKLWTKVTYQSIDNYLHIESTNTSDYDSPLEWAFLNLYPSIADIPEEEVDAYMAHVQYLDSLQEVYTKRISEIIEKGEFGKAFPIYRTY